MKMKYRVKQCVAVMSAAALLLSGVELSGVSQAASKPALNKKKVTIRVGKTVQLKLKRAKKKVTWKSSKKAVAVVSGKGLVKGKSQGVAKIVAYSAGKKYTCRVTVKDNDSSLTDDSALDLDSTMLPSATKTAVPTQMPVAPGKTAVPTTTPEVPSQTPVTEESTEKPTTTPVTEEPAEEPTTTTEAPSQTPATEEPTGGNHILADASEGLTVSADDDVYSFKLGQTATEITTGFGEPARKDKSPQGYEVYVYYNTYASYFQVYIDNGIVVGAATMSSGFNYKDIVSQGAAASALTGFSSLPSKYYYQDAYYRETDSEYISVYLDSYGTVGTKGVYAVQVFSTTNGSGEAVAMDDLYMGNSISDNGGYSDAKVLSDMAAEIFDWGCAFRVSKGLVPFQKFTIDNIGDTVAQSLSDYNATMGTSNTTDSSGRGLKARFSQEYAVPGGWDDCYVSSEIVADASPDALGYFTWSINSSFGGDTNQTNYNNILKTKNTKEDIEIGPYYLCVGVSFNSSKKATFAVMDMFSLY